MAKTNPFRKYLTKEDLLQEACMMYLALQFPKWQPIHCPSEGKRSAFERYKFKVLGGSEGVSDILIMEENKRSKGLAIELKYGSNKCSRAQVEFLEDMSRKGYTAAVVYDHVDEFKSLIEDHVKGNIQTNPEGHIILRKNGKFEHYTYQEAMAKLVPQESPHLKGLKRKPRVKKGQLFSSSTIGAVRKAGVILATLFVTSCTVKVAIPTEPTLWKVAEISDQYMDKRPGLTSYRMVPINTGDLNIQPVWVIDSVGRWQEGDWAAFGRFE